MILSDEEIMFIEQTRSRSYLVHARAIEAKILEKQSVQEPSIPEGWQLVPVIPTDAMIEAVLPKGRFTDDQRECLDVEYQQMLAAAPKVKP